LRQHRAATVDASNGVAVRPAASSAARSFPCQCGQSFDLPAKKASHARYCAVYKAWLAKTGPTHHRQLFNQHSATLLSAAARHRQRLVLSALASAAPQLTSSAPTAAAAAAAMTTATPATPGSAGRPGKRVRVKPIDIDAPLLITFATLDAADVATPSVSELLGLNRHHTAFFSSPGTGEATSLRGAATAATPTSPRLHDDDGDGGDGEAADVDSGWGHLGHIAVPPVRFAAVAAAAASSSSSGATSGATFVRPKKVYIAAAERLISDPYEADSDDERFIASLSAAGDASAGKRARKSSAPTSVRPLGVAVTLEQLEQAMYDIEMHVWQLPGAVDFDALQKDAAKAVGERGKASGKSSAKAPALAASVAAAVERAAAPRFAMLGGDGVCNVCGEGETESNTMLRCSDRCGVLVHRQCYGDERRDVTYDAAWVCQACAVTRKQALRTCMLCPVTTGALWRVRDANAEFVKGGRWAHVSCVIWLPEMRLARQPSGAVEAVAMPYAERFGRACALCGSAVGATLRCESSRGSFVHATCAVAANWHMELRAVEPTDEHIGVEVHCYEETPPSGHQQRRRPRASGRGANARRRGPPQVVPETEKPLTVFTMAQLMSGMPATAVSGDALEAVVRHWMRRRCADGRDGRRPLVSALQLLYEGSFKRRTFEDENDGERVSVQEAVRTTLRQVDKISPQT
jgi:hypothetical protein